MKRPYSIIAFFCCILAFVSSCEKAPLLVLNTPSSISFTEQGGTQKVSFTANRDWTVSSSESWCKVSPSSGLKSEGELSFTITCDPNTTYDSRNATVAIKAEEIVESLIVTQEENIGLIVSPLSYNIDNTSQLLEVEIRSNVNYLIEIEKDCQGWIFNANTKALSSEKLVFNIAANESFENREGRIVVKQKDGSLSETIRINQSQMDGLFIGKKEYEVGREGDTVEIKIQTNCEYYVLIPDESQEWISHAESTPTKGMEDYSVFLRVAENTSFYDREASLIIKTVNDTRYEEIIIKQGKTDALFITDVSKEYDVVSKGGEVRINVFHNIPFELDKTVLPSWISVSSEDKDQNNTTFIVIVESNPNYSERCAQASFRGGDLSDSFVIKQHQIDTVYTDLEFYEAPWKGDEFELKIYANTGYFINRPAWITELSKNSYIEGELFVDTFSFKVEENLSDNRRDSLEIKWDNEAVETTIEVFVEQDHCSVNNVAGTLNTILSDSQIREISYLQLSGEINGSDVILINRMDNLSILDMKDARVVKGGKPYNEGNTTEDDVISRSMFEHMNLTRVFLPLDITLIDSFAFFACDRLENVVFGPFVRTINPYAFQGTMVNNLEFPESLINIEAVSFSSNNNLTTLTLPKNLNSIGEKAFAKCVNLKEVHIKAQPSTLTDIAKDAFSDSYDNAILYIPKGTYDEYYLSPLGKFKTIVEE